MSFSSYPERGETNYYKTHTAFVTSIAIIRKARRW